MARGDWLKSGNRWCHRDDVEPSARELRKGEDRRRKAGHIDSQAIHDYARARAQAGPPVVHLPRAATLLTSEAREAIADALEILPLDRRGRERATEWIACFRSGDWSRVPAWLSVEDTELVYRGIQVALKDTPAPSTTSTTRPSTANWRRRSGQLVDLLGAFSPYRFDEDTRPRPPDLVTDDITKGPS